MNDTTREQVAFCAGCGDPIIGGTRTQGWHRRQYWTHATPRPASPVDLHAASPLWGTVIRL